MPQMPIVLDNDRKNNAPRPPAAGPPILTVRDLNIEFHDEALPETVVHNFNLELYPGEIVGIVGESGSGKSMSALAVAGLLRRRDLSGQGEIIYRNHNLLTCPRRILRQYQGKEIGMVFQEPLSSLNPVRRIGSQVEESLLLHTGLSAAQRYEKTVKMLRDVELDHPERVYRQYPHELSGGMRQRVMIAAAMICEPRILIADEPTTALDVTVQAAIIELLKNLNREKQTAILFISHDLSLVNRLCGRVLVMQGGHIVESGETAAVLRHPRQDYTRRLVAAIPAIPAAAVYSPTVPASAVPSSAVPASAVSSPQGPSSPVDHAIITVEKLSAFYTESGIGGMINSGKRNRIANGKGHRRQVLAEISFTMKAGEILGLAGESGSGKSTLVKTILGINKDYTGRIEHTSQYPQMVFQDPYGALNPVKKIGWILEEPLRVRGGLNKSRRREKVRTMLERVGLEGRIIDRYPHQLSGGQRQRVGIAAALMLEPQLLIADEAVSALDVTIQAQILDLLLSLHREMGLSILFISHDLRVIYKICDRVMIMHQGRICETGTTAEIFFAPQADYTRELLRTAGI